MSAVTIQHEIRDEGSQLLSWICRFLPAEPTEAPNSSAAALLQIFDQCGVATILADGRFNCTRTTASAAKLLERGICLGLTSKRITCPLAPLDFRRAFLEAIQLNRVSLAVKEPGDGACWQMRLIPIPFDDSRHVLIFVAAENPVDRRVAAERVQALLKLTAGESQLVAGLANGMTTRSYADGQGLSIHTVRNQLKSVYLKLDIHSQKDLTAHVLRRCALSSPIAPGEHS